MEDLEEKLTTYKAQFIRFDTDGSGDIDFMELKYMLEKWVNFKYIPTNYTYTGCYSEVLYLPTTPIQGISTNYRQLIAQLTNAWNFNLKWAR